MRGINNLNLYGGRPLGNIPTNIHGSVVRTRYLYLESPLSGVDPCILSNNLGSLSTSSAVVFEDITAETLSLSDNGVGNPSVINFPTLYQLSASTSGITFLQLETNIANFHSSKTTIYSSLGVPDGSASTASVYRNGDINTGFYFDSVDGSPCITAGGTKRLKIDATGATVTGKATLSTGLVLGSGSTLSTYIAPTSFTPTYTTLTGTYTTAPTHVSATYSRIGKIVYVQFRLTMQVSTANTSYYFRMTVPVNTSAYINANGHMWRATAFGTTGNSVVTNPTSPYVANTSGGTSNNALTFTPRSMPGNFAPIFGYVAGVEVADTVVTGFFTDVTTSETWYGSYSYMLP